MEIPEFDRESGFFDLISEDLSDYISDDTLFPIADRQPAIDGNKPQAPNTESFVTESAGNDQFLFAKCLAELSDVFPDISSEYVRGLFNTWRQPHLSPREVWHDLTIQILDAGPYPKEKDRLNQLKRKRSPELNSDEKDTLQWKNDKKGKERASYLSAARSELQDEFVNIPVKVIELQLEEKGSYYAAYLALEQAEWTYRTAGKSPYGRLKRGRKQLQNAPNHRNVGSQSHGQPELEGEIQAAKVRTAKLQEKRKAEADAAKAEAAVEQMHRDNGDVFECQCCFETLTINKITHCDGDTLHYFCLDCARKNANNEMGNMRYKLICMSGDGCVASFSPMERERFLDDKALKALERMQLQAEIKQAGLEGFTSCPFCDYGAICDPVELDREFRCRKTDCEKVSCRICKSESHLPLSCDEYKQENRISERHVVEEARTAALLKQCPQCNVPIFKDEGCNRLSCPCGGTLCDFCGKNITGVGYSHFSGEGANGRGNLCPTYDDINARRRNALKNAEATALKGVCARNPNLNLNDLDLDFRDKASSIQGRLLKDDHHRGDLALQGLAFPDEPVHVEAAPAVPPAVRPPGAAKVHVPVLDPYGDDGGLGIPRDRALTPPRYLPPATHPAVAPANHAPLDHRTRRRIRSDILSPPIIPQDPYKGEPIHREGFAFIQDPVYQHPSFLPAYGPITIPDLYPTTAAYRYPRPLPEPALGLHSYRQVHPDSQTEEFKDLIGTYNRPGEHQVQRGNQPVENRTIRPNEPIDAQTHMFKGALERRNRLYKERSKDRDGRVEKFLEDSIWM